MGEFYQYALAHTSVVGIALLIVFLTPQYNVVVEHDTSKYVASCHWDQGIMYDKDGKFICRRRSFFYGCKELIESINAKSNGCVDPNGASFVSLSNDLGEYTEQVTYNIIEMSVSVGLGLMLVWFLPRLVRRRRTAIFNIMAICHLAAVIFAGIYAVNASHAMDRLSRKDNYNKGQKVTIGLGFFAVLVLPVILLILDLFIKDWD